MGTMRYLLASLLALLLMACEQSSNTGSAPPEQDSPLLPGIPVADWQQTSSDQFEQAAAQWQHALSQFDRNPENASLKQLRETLTQWYKTLAGHYLLPAARACQLEQQLILDRLDSWPLYPGYIDALPEWPDSGLISDPYLEMSRKTLRTQHGATDSAEASLGFAALFVVLNGTAALPKPLNAFIGEEDSMARRRQWLALASEQLIADYRTLISDATLTAADLHCGLGTLLGRQQKQALPLEDNELVIPEGIRDGLESHLLSGLQALPQSVIEDWERSQPGIREALEQSHDSGWEAIMQWQETTTL